jgi:hypothetical protein
MFNGDNDGLMTDSRRTDALIRDLLKRVPAQPLPDLGPAVLRRIRDAGLAPAPTAAKRPAAVRIVNWFWSPRPIALQWRPAYAFALLVLLALTPLAGRALMDSTPSHQQVLVQFRLDAPDARGVQLAGNFTNWKATVAMNRTGNGVWTVVLPLEPGVHSYSFVVDGERWVADPTAPAVSDGFGGQNSQLAVMVPDQARSL